MLNQAKNPDSPNDEKLQLLLNSLDKLCIDNPITKDAKNNQKWIEAFLKLMSLTKFKNPAVKIQFLRQNGFSEHHLEKIQKLFSINRAHGEVYQIISFNDIYAKCSPVDPFRLTLNIEEIDDVNYQGSVKHSSFLSESFLAELMVAVDGNEIPINQTLACKRIQLLIENFDRILMLDWKKSGINIIQNTANELLSFLHEIDITRFKNFNMQLTGCIEDDAEKVINLIRFTISELENDETLDEEKTKKIHSITQPISDYEAKFQNTLVEIATNTIVELANLQDRMNSKHSNITINSEGYLINYLKNSQQNLSATPHTNPITKIFQSFNTTKNNSNIQLEKNIDNKIQSFIQNDFLPNNESRNNINQKVARLEDLANKTEDETKKSTTQIVARELEAQSIHFFANPNKDTDAYNTYKKSCEKSANTSDQKFSWTLKSLLADIIKAIKNLTPWKNKDKVPFQSNFFNSSQNLSQAVVKQIQSESSRLSIQGTKPH